jgi:hypothetical protein
VAQPIERSGLERPGKVQVHSGQPILADLQNQHARIKQIEGATSHRAVGVAHHCTPGGEVRSTRTTPAFVTKHVPVASMASKTAVNTSPFNNDLECLLFISLP